MSLFNQSWGETATGGLGAMSWEKGETATALRQARLQEKVRLNVKSWYGFDNYMDKAIEFLVDYFPLKIIVGPYVT